MNHINVLACPKHKTELELLHCKASHAGEIKYGSLYCPTCRQVVASINHGKVDFLRICRTLMPEIDHSSCDPFNYKRIPWNSESINATGLTVRNLGWNAEGFTGSLYSDSDSGWTIVIETDATDVALRLLCHSWGGAINVTIGDGVPIRLDLYSNQPADVTAFPLYRDLTGKKKIVIEPATKNPASNANQVFFLGMDACFAGQITHRSGNRGNGFPATYAWALSNLNADALVLDCGSGDRKFSDPRVISFEYMDFEYPDVFGDGHALPFIDNSFDVVFSQAVMEHMRDPYLAAREIARVTKPGGLIYVESAFMQPLHAVPYHFFNTTIWGIESIFTDANVETVSMEWFGPLSTSIEWYLNTCGGGGLNADERTTLTSILRKADSNTSYENLKPVASAVAFWGIKCGGVSDWHSKLQETSRPTFKY